MADNTRAWTKFGRYALLQKIGAGGMAEIYRAKTFGAAGFEKEFAIKLILPSLVDDTEFVDMFINEAKIAVSLYHANIVQVFDLGELDNQYFIAMEYVHGKDLLDVLARCAEMNIKIPLNLVLFVGMEMLKGLDFAHRAKDPYGDDLNIIHRDVSPSNILISYAGDVKVGDFGVAKAAIQRTLTESGTLKGKVGYMSPEQVMGEEIDNRSDIFSACIVLFEALSMNRLFVGSSDLDVMLKVRDADIGDSLKKAGPLPSDLIEIIDRGLAKHREDRFQTSGGFYQALVDFCFQHSIKVTGSDLSNFMRRLFAEEIEEEKSQRRSEPGGPAASRQMMERREQKRAASKAKIAVEARIEAGSQEQEKEEIAHDDAAAVRQPMAGVVKPRAKLAPKQGFGDSTDAEDSKKKYRYRDGTGLVFGPMGPQTLVDLIRVRPPRPEDRVSVGGGEWTDLGEIDDEELETALSKAGRSNRQASVDVSNTLREAVAFDKRSDEDIDTDVIRDVRRAIGQMEEEIVANRSEDYAPSIDFSVEKSSLANASTELVPPREAQELGNTSSPTSQHPPSMEYVGDLAQSTFRELKEQYASYEGDLGDISFARILGRLHRAGGTGRLYVKEGNVEKSIFIRAGEPIFVQSNKKEELLGSFLRSRDLITREELDEALTRLSEWGGRLGDALVAIGAIPAHSIFKYLSDQMREKLLEIFSWEGGYYGYFENQEPDTQGYSLGLDTYGTIVEGTRERIDFERIKGGYRNRSFVSIYPNNPPPFAVDRLGLRARELRVFNELDSGDTLRTLLGKFAHDQHETVYRTIYLLHQVEIISFEVTEKFDLPEIHSE